MEGAYQCMNLVSSHVPPWIVQITDTSKMATVADVPHLVAALAKCLAVTDGLQHSAQAIHRMTSVAHDILLGLHEVNDLSPENCSSCVLWT